MSSKKTLWENIHSKEEYKILGVSKVFEDYVKFEKITEIVDIGCGTGRNIKYISSLFGNIELYATDIYPEVVNVVKSSKIETSVHDMRDCPIKSNYLSHAISWRVLHHHEARERAEAVDEIRRIIKPDGSLIMAVRSIDDWSYGFGTPTEENSFVVLDQKELPRGLPFFPKDTYHPWHFFPKKEIIKLLEKYKFEITNLDKLEEVAGLPKWYVGNNTYWTLKATRSKKRIIYGWEAYHDRLL